MTPVRKNPCLKFSSQFRGKRSDLIDRVNETLPNTYIGRTGRRNWASRQHSIRSASAVPCLTEKTRKWRPSYITAKHIPINSTTVLCCLSFLRYCIEILSVLTPLDARHYPNLQQIIITMAAVVTSFPPWKVLGKCPNVCKLFNVSSFSPSEKSNEMQVMMIDSLGGRGILLSV